MLKTETVYVKAGAAVLLAGICFAAVYTADNSVSVKRDGNGSQILERGDTGDSRVYDMKMKTGDIEQEISVTVTGRKYTEEELQILFEDVENNLEKIVLGDNPSRDEVREDLNLVTEIPGTQIRASWESDNYDVIDAGGKIREEALQEEGTDVRLTALLSYEDVSREYELDVRIFPPVLNETEALLREVSESLALADTQGDTESSFVLPSSVGGKKVEWKYAARNRSFAILVIGFGIAAVLLVSASQKKKERQKRAVYLMQIDYPQIINKFNLYISAGMTVRKAWFMIAREYENRKKKGEERKAYEEMIYTMHRISGGASEGESYEQFGMRCGTAEYRKFGSLLSQNLKKGSSCLTSLLSREAAEAFEERRNRARKAGEEAGTKLMIPMFLMLIIVFAIVIIPAFFSIRI